MNNDKNRENFEKWYQEHKNDTIKHGPNGSAWELWQAATASNNKLVGALKACIEIMGSNGLDECDAYTEAYDTLAESGEVAP